MYPQQNAQTIEPNYLNWDLQHDLIERATVQLSTSNFQFFVKNTPYR